MSSFRRSSTVLLSVSLFSMAVAGGGCETSDMDKDLKRQADRVTITLDRTKAELAAAQAENERLRRELAALQQNAASGSSSTSELQAQLAAKDAQYRQALIRIRDLEAAATAARQGMPATRPATP